jgi:hypothetical protein
MPKKPRVRTARDYALLKKRYAKFLEIGALPSDERRPALAKFLDQINAGAQQESQEPAPAEPEVSQQQEPAIEDLFTDVTAEREGLGFILPGQQSQPAFPRRSPEELGKLIGTFLDLLIADGKNGKPN